jgi:imidazolonepropionase-like amidohydrolase
VIAGPLRTIPGYGSSDTAHARATRELQIHNLATLHRAGVRVAIGSDIHGQDAAPEAAYTAGLGVFTPAEMLRMWSETTPRLIFPARRIGRLEAGYEASLLVLGCDPLVRCSRQLTDDAADISLRPLRVLRVRLAVFGG